MNKQDRIEAEAIAADIQRRPAFHLATSWLARARRTYGEEATGTADGAQSGWVTVDRVLTAMQAHTGAHVNEETALVALEASGFKVRPSRRGAETNLADRVLVEAWASTAYGKTPARALPDFSDPTDAAMALH